ncbi:MAG: beta-lactamase family protein [Deltaproteobacteria bacterium]|nr:beta-lactamase family protein [Deltaproteobacteria bacterium]
MLRLCDIYSIDKPIGFRLGHNRFDDMANSSTVQRIIHSKFFWQTGMAAVIVLLCMAGCGEENHQHRPGRTRNTGRKSNAPGTPSATEKRAEMELASTSAYDFSELDQFLAAHRKLFSRTGVMIRKGGQIVYSFGDTSAPVNAASCSKWLGAAAIMRLVEQNQLALDTRAGKYIDNLRPRVRKLTLRQLLSHTGGLRAFDPCQENGDEESFPPLRSVVDNLRFQNGQSPAFCYDNIGFNFAGTIASKVVHKPWPGVFQEQIAGPLGLSQTFFSKQKPSLAGGAQASAADYSRFLETMRHMGVTPEGRRILKAETVLEMLKNQTAGMPMKCVPRPSPRKASYGLGMWRQGPDDKPWLASHFGTSGYKVFLDFCRDVTAVFILEYKPLQKQKGKDVTRNIYEIVERAIPVNTSCVRDMERDKNQWKPPLRRPRHKRKLLQNSVGARMESKTVPAISPCEAPEAAKIDPLVPGQIEGLN